MQSEGEYQSGWRLWSRLLIVSIAIVLLNWIGLSKYLRSGVEWVVNPALTLVRGARVRTDRMIRQVKFVSSGALQIIDLEREVAELTTSAARVYELEEENTRLRDQLGLLPGGYDIVDGEVVSSGDDRIIVNLERSGAQAGQVVLWKDNLVGYIESVGYRNVAVRLMSSSEYETSVKIISVSGLLIGEGVLVSDQIEGMVVEGVSRESEMGEDMLVVTKGDEIFEGDLVIGKITRVVSTDADVVQSAVVAPVFNISVGDRVFVVWEGTQ